MDLCGLHGNPGNIFKLGTVDIYRKNSTPYKFKQAIFEAYGDHISMVEARRIVKFFEAVDLFSPSLIVEDRTTVTVNEAPHGAFSMDFAGLGAQNLLGTIEALLQAETAEEGIQLARVKEQEVTKIFNERKKELVEKIEFYFGQGNTHVAFSGDEGVVVPSREIRLFDIMQLHALFFEVFGESKLRLTFMPPDQNGSGVDTSLVSAAEAVEKTLRRELTGELPPELMEATQFLIHMEPIDGTQNYRMRLIMYSGVEHTTNQRNHLRQVFRDLESSIAESLNLPFDVEFADEINASFAD